MLGVGEEVVDVIDQAAMRVVRSRVVVVVIGSVVSRQVRR